MTTTPCLRSFDPYRVETWSCFIEQDDPRAITCDLRFAIESAFEVHAYSAKCRQSVLRSMLLWASLARAQRRLVAWDSEDNIGLGQGLVQHMFDLTAETQGINSDEIHAALRAEQHPFLKKMYELQQARTGAPQEWRGSCRAPGITATRSTTYPVSPTPAREPSVQVPTLRAPTVLAESHSSVEPCHNSLASVAEPQRAAAPPAPVPIAAETPEEGEPATAAVADPAPHRRVATPPQPPSRNGFATASGAAATPSPTNDTALQRTTPSTVTPPPNGHATAPHRQQLLPPPPSYAASTTRVGTEAGQPVAVDAPLPKNSAKRPAAAGAVAVAAPPVYQPVKSAAAVATAKAPVKTPQPPPPATRAPASVPAVAKSVVAARPSPPSQPNDPTPFVARKAAYTYTDPDTASSSSEAEAPPPSSRPVAPTPPPPPGPAEPVSDAALRKYGDGGTDDLVQAFWNDLPVDADGVPAWFARRLATTEEDRRVPLAARPVAPLSLDLVQRRMDAKLVKRLDALFALLQAAVPAPLPPHEEAAALLTADDVAALSAAGLIRRTTQATGDDTVLAFTVVDTTAATPLRRFLAWPRGSNEHAIESGYEPRVPLNHISTYLEAVNAPSGCVERFERFFDQIELSPKVQERFVFTDAQQQRWCLTRLPLGHTVATEIVQIVLSIIVGHPSYALKDYALPDSVRVDVWVYTIRLFGPAGDVRTALVQLRAACDKCGVVPSAAVAASDVKSARYDFLGVHFDHSTHTVSLAKDHLGRLEPPRRNISTRDLERQYTQLLFCSATGHVAASGYYKVLKTVCRRLAALQQHPELLHVPSLLPEEAFVQVQRWHTVVSHNTPRQVQAVPLPSMSLFVELSVEKWQAVLVSEETQETWNAEGSLEDMLGTRIASASITTAISCFRPCIEKGAHVFIKIIGGSAMGRNEKPICKNEPEEGISECIRTHLVTRTFSFEVAYIELGVVKGDKRSAVGPAK